MTNTDIKARSLDEIYETEGYKVAKAEADRRNVVWFASAGAKRKRGALGGQTYSDGTPK